MTTAVFLKRLPERRVIFECFADARWELFSACAKPSARFFALMRVERFELEGTHPDKRSIFDPPCNKKDHSDENICAGTRASVLREQRGGHFVQQSQQLGMFEG